ncbi:MAG: hypothetical protein JXR19_11130 [Bacteroidia bacterium]
MKKFLALLAIIATLAACKSKTYSLENLPKSFIEMGNFGGFAGSTESFYLFPNGQRLYSHSISGNKELVSGTKKDFKSILKELKEMGVMDMTLDQPGNMNYYLRIKTKKIDHKLIWTDGVDVPKELSKYLNNLMMEMSKDPIE